MVPAAVMASAVIVDVCDTFDASRPGPTSLANPKSSIFTVPSERTMMFAGFEIAVNDAPLVRGVERLGNLCGDWQCFVDRNRAAPDDLCQILRPRRVPSLEQ